MKKVKFNVLIALCAMMFGLSFTSCNKENGQEPQPEEDSIIGKWVCYGYTMIDTDYDKSSDCPKAQVYSAVFTDSTAKLHLSFYEEDKTIETDYRFKEGDEGIIYFQKAFDQYGYRIVGKYVKAQGSLVIEATSDYWDVLEHYEMVKQ